MLILASFYQEAPSVEPTNLLGGNTPPEVNSSIQIGISQIEIADSFGGELK